MREMQVSQAVHHYTALLWQLFAQLYANDIREMQPSLWVSQGHEALLTQIDHANPNHEVSAHLVQSVCTAYDKLMDEALASEK